MIDFKEEIQKYQPVLGIENADADAQQDEVKDIMEMLQYITQKATAGKE